MEDFISPNELNELNQKTLELLRYLTIEYLANIPQKKDYYLNLLETKFKEIHKKGYFSNEDIVNIVGYLEKEMHDSPVHKKIISAYQKIFTDYQKLFNILHNSKTENILKEIYQNFMIAENEDEKEVLKDIQSILNEKQYSEYSAEIINDAIKNILFQEDFDENLLKDKNLLKNKIIGNSLELLKNKSLEQFDKQKVESIIKNSDYDKIINIYFLTDEEDKDYINSLEELYFKIKKPEKEEEFLRKNYIASNIFQEQLKPILDKSFYKEKNINSLSDFIKTFAKKDIDFIPEKELFLNENRIISKNEKFIEELNNLINGIKKIQLNKENQLEEDEKNAIENVFEINPKNKKMEYLTLKNLFDNYFQYKANMKNPRLINEDNLYLNPQQINEHIEGLVNNLAFNIFANKDPNKEEDVSLLREGLFRMIPYTNSKRQLLECLKTVNVKARMYDTAVSNAEQCLEKYLQNVRKETQNIEHILNNREINYAFFSTPLASFFIVYMMANIERERNMEKRKMAFLEEIDRIKKLTQNVKTKDELKNLYKYVNNVMIGKKIDPSIFSDKKDLNSMVSFAIKDIDNALKPDEYKTIEEYHAFLKENYKKNEGKTDFPFESAFEMFSKYIGNKINIQKTFLNIKDKMDLLDKIEKLEKELISTKNKLFELTKKEHLSSKEQGELKKIFELNQVLLKRKESLLNSLNNLLDKTEDSKTLQEKLKNINKKIFSINENLKSAYKNKDFSKIKELIKEFNNLSQEKNEIYKKIKNGLTKEKDLQEFLNERVKYYTYMTNYQMLEKTYNKIARKIYEKEFDKGLIKEKNFLKYKTQMELLIEQEKDLKEKIINTIKEIRNAKQNDEESLSAKQIKLQYYVSTYNATIDLMHQNIKNAKDYFQKYYSQEIDKDFKVHFYKIENDKKIELKGEELKDAKNFITMLNQYGKSNFYKYLDDSLFKGKEGLERFNELINYSQNLNDALFAHLFESKKPAYMNDVKIKDLEIKKPKESLSKKIKGFFKR